MQVRLKMALYAIILLENMYLIILFTILRRFDYIDILIKQCSFILRA